MPTEDRIAKGAARCTRHPGSASVATCDGCGRALCLACAVPVRGLVFGAECLPDDVAEDVVPPPTRAPLDPVGRWTGVWLLVALAATFLPWTRFGRGSGSFGAWNATWAGCAGVAFLLAALLWTLIRLRPGRWHGRVPHLALTALTATGLIATLLALLRPPAFARPWIGPWVAIAAGTLALAGAVAMVVRDRRGTPVPGRARLG